MRDLPELRERLAEAVKERDIQSVAKEVGLHYNTIRHVANGEKKDPRYFTLKAINEWCDRRAIYDWLYKRGAGKEEG